MLPKEIQSLCNFSFLEIVKIEPANKVQNYFLERDAFTLVKRQFPYLSLYYLEWNEPKLPL
jgi:hypothetical protein